MYFDKAGWFWYWLIASAILWTPIANGFHPIAFRRAWLILSIIWWLPIALGELLRLGAAIQDRLTHP